MVLQPEPRLVPAVKHRIAIAVSNSRFIATVDHAETLESAKQMIAVVRNEMPDATHHVYAFRVGHGNSVIEGMSDAGEPSGTAGPPIMAVLRGSRLGDIVMVITRYFGGVKLGKGGLVQTYTEAAQLCLAALPTTPKILFETIGIDVSYSLYEAVRRLIVEYEGVIEEETFLVGVSIIAKIPCEKAIPFAGQLGEITSGQVKPVFF